MKKLIHWKLIENWKLWIENFSKVGLFHFLMQRMLFAEFAIFVHFQFFFDLFLVAWSIVCNSFTFTAFHLNQIFLSFCRHICLWAERAAANMSVPHQFYIIIYFNYFLSRRRFRAQTKPLLINLLWNWCWDSPVYNYFNL